jgi:hypothetical protein
MGGGMGIERAMKIRPGEASIKVLMIMEAATRARRINPVRDRRVTMVTKATRVTRAMARMRITRNCPQAAGKTGSNSRKRLFGRRCDVERSG